MSAEVSRNSTNTIKVWLTKHALTSGIKVVDGKISEVSSNMVCYNKNGRIEGYYYDYVHGRDWHRTKEAALERAEEMRRAKIESLRQSIRKLEELEFYVPEENEP